jgi:hypothetical protein
MESFGRRYFIALTSKLLGAIYLGRIFGLVPIQFCIKKCTPKLSSLDFGNLTNVVYGINSSGMTRSHQCYSDCQSHSNTPGADATVPTFEPVR